MGQQAETTKMPGYRGRNYKSSGNDGLVARQEEERIRKYREKEAAWEREDRRLEQQIAERRREQQRKDESARALGFNDAQHKKREDYTARKQGFDDAQHKRREDDSARELGYDDAQHKKRITAAMDKACGKVEKMKNDGLAHVTLTVQSADDGGQTEVTVSDEARVADVLAVACRAQMKPLPRSTLSFGGDNLDAFMAEKLTDLDIETDAVLRLVQLCDGQVNDLALGALTEKDGPTHCTCFSWLFSR